MCRSLLAYLAPEHISSRVLIIFRADDPNSPLVVSHRIPCKAFQQCVQREPHTSHSMFAWRAAYFLTAILVTSNSGTLASATQVSPLDVPHVFLRPLVFENVVAFESSPMPYFSLCAVQNNHLHNLLLLFEIMMFFKDRSLALITLSLCWIAITPSSVYAADSDPTGFGEMFR